MAIGVVRSEEVVKVRLVVTVVVESELRAVTVVAVACVVAVAWVEEMGVVVVLLELELGLSVRLTRVIVVMVMSSVSELDDGLSVMDETETSVIGTIVPGVVKAASAMSGVMVVEHGVTSS